MTEVLCFSSIDKACKLIFATPFMAYAMSTGDPYAVVDALIEEGYNSRVANAAVIAAYTEIRTDTVGVLEMMIEVFDDQAVFDDGPNFTEELYGEELYDDHPNYAVSVHALASRD